ncbi:MAG: M42 family metallopeptidase [Christensenellales bacterium]
MEEQQLYRMLQDITSVPGLSGLEHKDTANIKRWFSPYCDEIYEDAFGSVYALAGPKDGVKVFVAAHFDAIGLMVRSVEKSGFLGIAALGGIDASTLAAHEVTVQTQKGPLFGVIGTKPPHVLSEKDRKKKFELNDLYVDVGLPYDEAVKIVRVGDEMALHSPLTRLAKNTVTGRALDNRAGVAVMADAMARYKEDPGSACVIFCASAQEETGSRGAMLGAYRIKPDLAVVVDVTHGDMNGAPPASVVAFDKPAITRGVTADRRITHKLETVAKELELAVDIEVAPGKTHTDADTVSLAGTGVPAGVLCVPVRYMHTTAETMSLTALRNCGKLLHGFLKQVDASWEAWPWK